MKKQKGYILQKAKNFVCIAVMQSTNIKTGGPKTDENMVQLYILYPHMKPIEASIRGLDVHVCGDCKHRHHSGGACYVNLGHGPRATYEAYKNGVYYDAPDSVEQFLKVVERDKRAVRFGAYGDPAFISQDLVKKISAVASKVTGYTHQWKKRAVDKSLMLSVDSLQEKKEANAKGFRTFRVTFKNDLRKDEIRCLNETDKKITCIKCGLCDGRRSKKNIAIMVHGTRQKRFSSVA